MADKIQEQIGFHGSISYGDIQTASSLYKEDSAFEYTFENFFHPFVGELLEKLNKKSLKGLLDPTFHKQLAQDFFAQYYEKLTSNVVTIHHFEKEIDLDHSGPYANYNWELLFHMPLMIAVHLSKNQRFAEAQQWFHFIFDPTSQDVDIPIPNRYWKFLDFREERQFTRLEDMLLLLSKIELTASEEKLRRSVLNSYEAVRNNPFQPHAVARTRPHAYQYSVVMKYLDNLLAWGDSLFRQDTVESINEATQRYVLAANLLGERPQLVPSHDGVRPKTFAELKADGLDKIGNALVELEGKFPFNLGLPLSEASEDLDRAEPLFGIGRTLYFCIPHNEKLLSYWDKVADRLFKIRHCMNIDGVVRQLALFDPPLDPGMLVKATDAGISLDVIMSGNAPPIGTLRSIHLIQKALELCSEVRSLGSAVLSALEKKDGEQLALMRQGHELKIQQMTKEVRFLQWKQAQEATESLLKSRASVLDRYLHYKRLLGIEGEDDGTSEDLPLQRTEINEENFADVLQNLVSQYDRDIAVPEFDELELKEDGKLALLVGEYEELNGHAERALAARLSAAGTEVVTGVLSLIPTFHLNASYWGIGPAAKVGGGDPLAAASRAVTTGFNMWAQIEDHLGQYASKKAGYERRADEWVLQLKLAGRELMHIGRQMIGALLAEQAAHKEYLAMEKQIEHAEEIDQFLQSKFTNEQLYAWMQGESAKLYYEYYRFAVDTARQAEQTMKRELMRAEVDGMNYIKFNYWDSGRKGLLSGESLYLDVKRMEMAYHEHNKREYELTKHISLRQLDPFALLTLKATGSCQINVPEWLYDLDGPGHYCRRIKSVSLSLPSVTGPYTSVNCTLTLLKSSLRKSPLTSGAYGREDSEDTRFIDYYGAIQSIVTSSGQQDSGMFEMNLRDDRFLPFEGAGAVGTWKLELPAQFRQFDYNTISDVIIHVRYTAREGGAQLKHHVEEDLRTRVQESSPANLSTLLSLSHDFPTAWYQYTTHDESFSALVKRHYFPYFTHVGEIRLQSIKLCTLENLQVETVEVPGLDLGALSEQLQAEQQFELTFPNDPAHKRDAKANVFAIIEYSLELS